MKTTFAYDHYFLYAELKANLEYFAKTYPELCRLETICVTPENRDLLAVTLSAGDAEKKPAYYIDGNTHAGEVTGSMAAMHTIDYLLTNYGKEDWATKILDRFTVYVIPRIAVDGAETYLSTPYSLRSVNRPYLYEKQPDGLYPEDINQDGVIAMMRFKSDDGVWVKDPDQDILMKERTPDMMDGEFYHIYTEGLMAGDKRQPAPVFWGLDFNRNYPYGWYTENRQPGAGPYPLSNPENKAVVDFVLAHPNIGGVATHHTSGGIILYPPGTRPEKTASPTDMRFFKEIGRMGTAEMGYGCINIFDSFFEDQSEYSSGAFDDWCYQSQGIPAYTIELWNLEERAGNGNRWPVSKEPKTTAQRLKELNNVYAWVQEHAPEAILPWRKFNHPQLGEVEIGGLASKFTFQNPPCDYLLQEVEKATRFTLRMACTLPRVAITKVDKEKLAEGIYRVDVTIANQGYLPTRLTDSLVSLKLDHALTVKISGDVELVSGEKETSIENLEGFGCIRSGVTYGANIQTAPYQAVQKTLTYVVKADDSSIVEISCEGAKTGLVTKKITLS